MTHYDFLIVHSCPDTRGAVESALRARPDASSVKIRSRETAGEGLALLAERTPDCLLLEADVRGEIAQGWSEALEELPCPTVAVVEGTSAKAAMRALRRGAGDYIFETRVSEPVVWQAVEYAITRYRLQRQLDLRHRKLARLDDELRRKTWIKSSVMASATHDLRTPITAIVGMVSMLRQRNLDQQTQNTLKSMAVCCDALLFSLNDILDLADLQSGKLVLTRNIFHPENVVQAVLETARVWASGKGLRLRCELPETLPQVLGDERRTRQVLFNLVSNAIKFTEHGEVLLRASLHSQIDDEVWILFEVCDTGIGIAPADRKRIFRRNVQAAPWGNEGQGLGLWVVKQLALRLGGTLGVKSRLGRGSTFSICLPYQATARPPSVEIVESHAGNRILIAEDNSMLARVLSGQLQHLGYQVRVAKDGREAVDYLSKERFDLAVFDARMPRMDGFAACREARKLPGVSTMPIILLTADSLVEEQVWRRSGFNQLLVKPVEIASLDAVIRQLLATRTDDESDLGIPSSLR